MGRRQKNLFDELQVQLVLFPAHTGSKSSLRLPALRAGELRSLLVDERSLSTKVFTIIEISSKKWWKQKLGTEYRNLQEYQFSLYPRKRSLGGILVSPCPSVCPSVCRRNFVPPIEFFTTAWNSLKICTYVDHHLKMCTCNFFRIRQD